MKRLPFIFFVSLFTTAVANAQLNQQNPMLFSGAMTSFGNAIPSVPNFAAKNQTIGSEYLFENWVSGSLTDLQGNVISDGYQFNFNKVSQNIYYRPKDSAVAFLVNKTLVKSISLSDGFKTYTLERIPSGEDERLYCVLVKTKKYSLFSLTETSFVPANFFTNGFTSSGSMYDEFKDKVRYFLVNSAGARREVPLKRKAVKKIFEAEKEKVNDFFKKNNTAGVFGEETLKSLVESVSL